MDTDSITEFIKKYNEAGGLNQNEDYENAVCFALEQILSIPNVLNEKVKSKYPFLVKRDARLAVFQNTIRMKCTHFFSIFFHL